MEAYAYESRATNGICVMSRSTSKPPLWEAVVRDTIRTVTDRWRGWIVEVDEALNGVANAVPADLTLTGSPFTFTNQTKSTVMLMINGGSVSAIQYTRDGVNFYSVPSGALSVFPGDQVRITYSATPTVTVVPR